MFPCLTGLSYLLSMTRYQQQTFLRERKILGWLNAVQNTCFAFPFNTAPLGIRTDAHGHTGQYFYDSCDYLNSCFWVLFFSKYILVLFVGY